MTLPPFLQIIFWIAAGLTAFGVIYYKGIRPMSRFISETERSVPIIKDLTEKLHDPQIVSVIVDMANQFKSDSGSSLRDVVNRIEDHTAETKASMDVLRATTEGSRDLQDADRRQLTRVLSALDRLRLKVDALTKKVDTK